MAYSIVSLAIITYDITSMASFCFDRTNLSLTGRIYQCTSTCGNSNNLYVKIFNSFPSSFLSDINQLLYCINYYQDLDLIFAISRINSAEDKGYRTQIFSTDDPIGFIVIFWRSSKSLIMFSFFNFLEVISLKLYRTSNLAFEGNDQ